jgi:hypothetical protein
MPRSERRDQLPIVAANPHTVCAMLCVRDEDIRPGINSGAIPVYVVGKRRRIVVEDAIRYLRTFPQPSRGPAHGNS